MAIGDLSIRLRANTAEFESDMGRAAHIASREMEGMVTRANAVGHVIGTAINQIAGHFSRLVGETLRMGDELNKLSQRTAISVERLSEIRTAAELADVSFSQLQTGLGFFAKALAEAQNESTKAAAVFKALGVDINAGPEKALEQFKNAINSLPDGEQKVAAMRAIFSKGGDVFIPMITSLDEVTARARSLGIVMSKQMAEDAEKFNDTIKLLSISGRALALNALAPISSALTQIADAMLRAKMRGEALIQVLKESWKLTLAVMSYIPGSTGQMADMAAMRLFKENAADPEAAPAAPAVNVDAAALARANANIKERAARARVVRDDTGREMERQIQQQRRLHDADLAAQKHYADEVRQIQEQMKDRTYYENIFGADAAGLSIDDLRKKFETTIQGVNELEKSWVRADLAAAGFDENFKRIIENSKEVNGWAKDLGLTFSSAFEDAIVNGKKLRDVLHGITQDIARMILRKTVTEPLANAVGKLDFGGIFKSLLGGGSSDADAVAAGASMSLGGATSGALEGAVMGPYAIGTSYVPRDGLAMVHKGEAIVPAAQNRGGPTIFIDARGADREGMRQLERTVAELNGTIEQRAVGAVDRWMRDGKNRRR